MPDFTATTPLEDTVVIVGVGLIGGSLAAAIKQRKIARHVVGIGRDLSRIEAARTAGLIDEAQTEIAPVVDRADLIVFCTPVGQVVQDVRRAETALSQSPEPAGNSTRCLLTDVGSVKGSICESLANVGRFIGSHPIAGSHRQGFEAADARLFQDRVCVLTPLATASKPNIERLERFWQAVGMQTTLMSPEAHDASLAMTSHVPHLFASALAMTLSDQNRPFVGSGFRDTTRVAGGSPDLWTDILLHNADQVRIGIAELQQCLSLFHEALAERDPERIRELLLRGQQIRASLDQKPPVAEPGSPDLAESES